jgi:precorrin-3B synthase
MTQALGGPVVKGWCPGALRPMASGDGLIVRLRISGGIVGTRLAAEIASWAARWGNRHIDLSGRGNLQLRGLSPLHLTDLHDAMTEWELLDRDAEGEAIRNVVSSPLAGIDPSAVLDIRPLAKALEQRLASDTALRALPAKFGFVIDDGGWPGLDAVAASVRFVARRSAGGAVFEVRLSGDPVTRTGICDPKQLVEFAAALGRMHQGNQTGRMRDIIDALGADAIGCDVDITPGGMPARDFDARRLLGPHPLGRAAFLGVGVPFGRMEAEDLALLASAAETKGATELRLTPWRAILVPVPSMCAAGELASELSTGPFILDPADPRRRVAACPGAPDCPQATTPVRNDAAVLVGEIAGLSATRIALHVSGCSKGCAHPHPAAITLVGQNGRYHLVRNGKPSDEPERRDLSLDQAAGCIRRIIAGAASVPAR